MFKVLKLHTIFDVFSGKIFFCSEFSSFEAVNWGFSGGVCQKISKNEAPPNLPLITLQRVRAILGVQEFRSSGVQTYAWHAIAKRSTPIVNR